MSKNHYGTGEVSRKLGVPSRTARDWAKKGKIPGQFPFWDEGHRRFRSEVIDRLAVDQWPPVKLSLKSGALEMQLPSLASDPLRVDPCPGELPEISAPDLQLPGLFTLPGWHLPRIPSPFEVSQELGRALWG